MTESEHIMETSQQSILLDDVPVPSASKDFNALLEECLRNSNISHNFEEKTPTKKFSYLKKGEGLARFYSNSSKEKHPTPSNRRRQSSCTNTKKENALPKAGKNSHSKNVAGKIQENPSKDIIQAKLESVNLDVSALDSETKMKKDMDEVRVFEIMEEKVENSSFCSTSSTIMAFLHHSSPLKSRLFMQSISREERSEVETKSQLEVPNSSIQRNFQKLEMNRWENLKDVVGVVPYGMDVAPNYESTDSSEKQNSSLHVRFSNLNEYRTYGLSDVSLLSANSEEVTNPSQIASSDDENSAHLESLSEWEEEEDSNSNYEEQYSDDETLPDTNSPEKEENPKDEIMFKSDLLKSRLIELKNEIDIFRKENAGLMEKQQKLEEECIRFREHVKESESKMNLEKQRVENYLQEEKKLIAREKNGLVSRLKNAQESVQKSIKEREELKRMKKELEELKDTMNQKDGKWLAQQGRYKSQLRVLQIENSKLKQEMEKLRESQSSKVKKNAKVNNTRTMHKINKILDGNCKKELGKKTVEESAPINTFQEINANQGLQKSGEKEDLLVVEEERETKSRLDENRSGGEEEFAVGKNEKLVPEVHFEQVEDEILGRQNIKKVVHCEDHIDVWYNNGNVKKVFPDKQFTKTVYYNGDVQEKYKDGKIRYFYSTTRTWHTTLVDGVDILEFPDGQIEKRWNDGTLETTFANGSIKTTQADGTIKWVLSDGTLVETSRTGEKILTLANGQREIHTEKHKRREYPDGTVKLVYSDGTQETRYASGRVRLKDSHGNLIMDSLH